MAGSERGEASTIPSEASGTDGWEGALRALAVTLISVVALAGVLGLLGVRSSVASSSGSGISLRVDHASIARPGLAIPFSISIESSDGSPLPPTVTTRVGSHYLEMFDENGLDPAPTSSFRTGDWTWWTFEVPDGSTELEVSFDARVEPAVQWGRSTTAAVEIDGTEIASVDFTTWVLP